MIQLTPQMHILLAVEPVDFRKDIASRPVQRSYFCVSQQKCYCHQDPYIRWSRFLALSKTLIPRAFQLVANQFSSGRKSFGRSRASAATLER